LEKSEKIETQKVQDENIIEWCNLIENSNNGTIFDHPSFISYHKNKFRIERLLFKKNKSVIAGISFDLNLLEKEKILKSPFGASYGGIIFLTKCKLLTYIEVYKSLIDYSKDIGVKKIYFTQIPDSYTFEKQNYNSFALKLNNFVLDKSLLTMGTELFNFDDSKVSRRKKRYIKKHEKEGIIENKEVDYSELEKFYLILKHNRNKFNVVPTHTLDELKEIFNSNNKNVKLYLSYVNKKIASGALVFHLTDKLANVFYLCHDEEFEKFRPSLSLALFIQKKYITFGFEYLDFGPSSFDDFSLNIGGIKFKEDIGCVGFCRDSWIKKL